MASNMTMYENMFVWLGNEGAETMLNESNPLLWEF